MSNMNINNKPIQQRIEELQKKSQPSETVSKQPIDTGLDRSSFEQRKAVFEQQTQSKPKPESLVSESVESELEESIDQVKPEGLQQRTEQLKGHQPGVMLSYTTPINQQGYDTITNYSNPLNYATNYKPGYSQDDSDDEYGNYESPELTLNTEPQGPQNPGKYQQTAENHHKPEYRQDSNVEGVQRGFEFNLGGRAKHTAMFKSEDAQNDNLLHFDESGVKRGDSSEGLSTQTPGTGIWAGSKNNRMLFVMSPEGKIYALDPSKPIVHKGQTVLDVRIHHSSLLNGQRVAGAGEIQVSAGLTPEEHQHLQNVVMKKVQEKVAQEKDIRPESAQKLIAMLVDEELGRMLKNHQPGQVEVISDRSGHYRPDLKMTSQVLSELEEQGVDISRVNVELGDKSNKQNIPEGELQVPSQTIQSMQDNKDGENVLRGVNARKQNMHQELLSKVKRTEGIDGVKDEVSSQEALAKLGQRQEDLHKYLRTLLQEKNYTKAAGIYERLELLKGVEIDTERLSGGKNTKDGQEEKILNMIRNDNTLTLSEKSEMTQAYQQLLINRQQKVEIRKVESEDPFEGYDDDSDDNYGNYGNYGQNVVDGGYIDKYGRPVEGQQEVINVGYIDNDGNPLQNQGSVPIGDRGYLGQNNYQEGYQEGYEQEQTGDRGYLRRDNNYTQGYQQEQTGNRGYTTGNPNYTTNYTDRNKDD